MDSRVARDPDVCLVQQGGLHVVDATAGNDRARRLVRGCGGNNRLLVKLARFNAGGGIGEGCSRCRHCHHPVAATRVLPSVYFSDQATIPV